MTRDMALLILGLSPSATSDEVKSAFKKKTLEWHPDKHGGAASKNDAMRIIVQAKQVLLGEEPERDELEDEDDEEDEEEAALEELIRDYMESKYGKPCKAYTATGYPCSMRAKKGNYGFCGRHR